jgi:GT2 family glycosyltransferase
MQPKITLIVGCGNNGYCLELNIRSFMKYNSEYVQQIIIADNSSTDCSVEFMKTNPFKEITKIIHYTNLNHRDTKGPIAMHDHIHLGIANCQTEWALLTHVDVMWKCAVVPEFYKILNNNPDLFMTGLGGGNPNLPEAIIHNGTTNGCRFHEWLLFLNITEWRKTNYSFASHTDEKGIWYDNSSWMYKQAYNSGKKLVTFDIYESYGRHIDHFACSSNIKKEEDSLRAKKILETEYWNKV